MSNAGALADERRTREATHHSSLITHHFPTHHTSLSYFLIQYFAKASVESSFNVKVVSGLADRGRCIRDGGLDLGRRLASAARHRTGRVLCRADSLRVVPAHR